MGNKEYIERGEAILAVTRDGCTANVVGVLLHMPAADVVEVVRCKDCKHWGGETFGYICKEWSGMTFRNYTKPDHYCSRGERKEQT